jgi:hypothetical protein
MLEHFHTRWKDMTKEDLLRELLTPTTTTNDNLISRFPPRWKAVLHSSMVEGNQHQHRQQQQQQQHSPSNQTKKTLPWIDAKFVTGYHGSLYQRLADKGIHVIGQRMEPSEMAKYKYQVDFGGGGGTTWEGTLLKLSMPGVLFHHESK